MRIYSHGLVFYLLLAVAFLKLSKIQNRQKKMNSTGKEGAINVYFLLIENGFSWRQAQFITAQAAHETGGFTSKIYQENNNCFGMKLALIRKTTATGEKNGHATYDNLEQCIKDYKIYYKNFKYLDVYPSIAAFVAALKRRKYFEAPELIYLRGCQFWLSEYFSQIVTVENG